MSHDEILIRYKGIEIVFSYKLSRALKELNYVCCKTDFIFRTRRYKAYATVDIHKNHFFWHRERERERKREMMMMKMMMMMN